MMRPVEQEQSSEGKGKVAKTVCGCMPHWSRCQRRGIVIGDLCLLLLLLANSRISPPFVCLLSECGGERKICHKWYHFLLLFIPSLLNWPVCIIERRFLCNLVNNSSSSKCSSKFAVLFYLSALAGPSTTTKWAHHTSEDGKYSRSNKSMVKWPFGRHNWRQKGGGQGWPLLKKGHIVSKQQQQCSCGSPVAKWTQINQCSCFRTDTDTFTVGRPVALVFILQLTHCPLVAVWALKVKEGH